MTTKQFLGGAALAATFASTRAAGAQAGLTIYNQNFGVVRDTIALNLQKGENAVSITDTTALLEPDSVVLRDPSGKRALQILEQNFRADALSQERLLSLYEGKTIDFLITRADGTQQTVSGKIIRSTNRSGQPIIEVDGKLRFQLPGVPLFPSLGDDTILKPQLNWKLMTDQGGSVNAELSYVTGGMTWDADYNVVAPEDGDLLDLTAWVTLTNTSGKTFPNARLQLIAGDVRKIQPKIYPGRSEGGAFGGGSGGGASVTEKSFDEYHLYTLARPSTLRDGETKQVEFARSPRIASKLSYVYDGALIDSRYIGYGSFLSSDEYGTQSNTKVAVMREFVNNEANGLGIPLPKGRVRFYRRESGSGALQFVGENVIDHTPQGETVRVNTGDSFDLVGERKRTAFNGDRRGGFQPKEKFADESFEITLRNRKKTPVEVRVVEHLYRWTNWEISAKSAYFNKTDAQTIEFRVPLAPDEEKKVTYTVHYSW